MADYVQVKNFTGLRGSTPSDPAVFDAEFALVAAASATKMDKTGGTFSGDVFGTPAPLTGATTKLLSASDIKHYAFAPTTVMAFFQATAPVGWTQVVTHNDSVLRVVSTAGGGFGGVDSPTTGLTATAAHALTIAEMPAHTHVGMNYGVGTAINQYTGAAYANKGGPTGVTGGDGVTAGTVTAHTHNIAWAPKYIDMILASKD